MLAAREIIVTHETARLWAEKFGHAFTNDIRRHTSGRLGDKRHLDAALVSIRSRKHWLWRAVDRDGSSLTFWCKAAATPRRPSSVPADLLIVASAWNSSGCAAITSALPNMGRLMLTPFS